MPFAVEITQTGKPDVLRETDKATPTPDAGEILIRNKAGAVNFIDTIIRRGEMPEGMMPDLPHIPGVEGAGLVEVLGEGSKASLSETEWRGWGRLVPVGTGPIR